MQLKRKKKKKKIFPPATTHNDTVGMLHKIWYNSLKFIKLQYIYIYIYIYIYAFLHTQSSLYFFNFFSFIFISWRLISLQYWSGFCHTLTWISHGFTCIPHPDPSSHLPLHPIPLGLSSAPAPSNCLMHPTWAGDLFHPR